MLRGLSRTTSRDATLGGSVNVAPSMNVSDGDYERTVKGTQAGGFTVCLVISIAACVLGSSFQFGYNLGVVNSPQKIIEQFINDSYFNQTETIIPDTKNNLLTWLWALTVAIFAIGGMIGGLTAGFFATKFGRKGALLLNNIVVIIGGALAAASIPLNMFELLIIARFLLGINCGISTGVVPLYLSETSPISIRGLAGTLNQFAIVLGVLVAQILGLGQVLGQSEYLPYLFGLTLAPAAFQLLVLPWCPETPQHLLMNKNDEQEARSALMKLRNTTFVQDEMDDHMQEKRISDSAPKVAMCDLFRIRALRQPLIISVVMQFSQQLSGINAIVFYSTNIFNDSGLDYTTASYATLGTGGVNVFMTFISALIMDKAGRRTLHLTGLSGMLVSASLLTLSFFLKDSVSWMKYISVVALILFIVFFALGPGSIPWFIVAELFDLAPRAKAMSIAVMVNWFANFLVGFCYPLLEDAVQKYSFIPFVVLLIIFVIFTYFKVPETKNKSIEEINRMFRDSGYEPLLEHNSDS